MKLPLLLTWPLLASLLFFYAGNLALGRVTFSPDWMIGAVVDLVIFLGVWGRRRWAVLLAVASSAVVFALQLASGHKWGPTLGPAVPIIIFALTRVPALLAWKRMSWAPLPFGKNSTLGVSNAHS